MLILRFDFPTGRYHATPWGAHVNEGHVEWPPSPWRILRALIAVGYGRLGWSAVPDEGHSLLLALSRVCPQYHLPDANASHTRHYMPLYNGDPTKVFDTFAYVGDAPLVVTYDVSLEPSAVALLDRLLDALPYLGRAESTVIGRRTNELPTGLTPCLQSETCPRPGLERVSLLAPEVPEAYVQWRAETVERERTTLLAEANAKAVAKGKKGPKTLSKKDEERIALTFPTDVIEALHANTKELQALGWSQPPGSRWVSYWRTSRALSAPVRRTTLQKSDSPPTTALLALRSDNLHRNLLPPLTDTVRRMETIHQALARELERLGQSSAALTGKADGVPLRGHRHASLVPVALGRRKDRIDHVLVHAPMGLDAVARRAIEALTATYAKDLPRLFVSLVGLGEPGDFARLIPLTRKSTVWRSRTPFVPPRYMKDRGKDTVEGQVHAELASRGVAEVLRVEVIDAAQRDFRHFRRARTAAGKQPPVALGLGLRLTFASPVEGPLCLGYASHFGLGSFEPEEA